MKEFVEKLKSCSNLCLGGKADVHHNIDARKYLTDQGMAVFPDEFFSLVKYVNGIVGDSARVYAIDTEEQNSSSDAVRQNERLNRADKETVAVLGYNVYDYLVYEAKEKVYQLRDRIDDVVIHSFQSLPAAIVALLGLR